MFVKVKTAEPREQSILEENEILVGSMNWVVELTRFADWISLNRGRHGSKRTRGTSTIDDCHGA
jgi:hypothetical protein